MAKSRDNVIARGADVPLALAVAAGPRDAMIDPKEGDIVPGIDDKGLHVGMVRQPAEPVLRGATVASADVEFESTTDRPSRFSDMTYAEQVKANSAWEAEQGDAYAGNVVQPILTDDKAIAAAKLAKSDSQRQAASATSSGSPTKADLRARLDALGAEQPGSRASADELQAAVDAAEGSNVGSQLAGDANSTAASQAAEDRQDQ